MKFKKIGFFFTIIFCQLCIISCDDIKPDDKNTLYIVSINGKAGFINNTGELLIPAEFEEDNLIYDNNYVLVLDSSKYHSQPKKILFGYIGGEKIIEKKIIEKKFPKSMFLIFTEPVSHFDPFLHIKVENILFGSTPAFNDLLYYSKNSSEKYSGSNTNLYLFTNKYGYLDLEKRSGLIDSDFNVIIPNDYQWIIPSSSDIYAVKQNDKWGYIDSKNKWIIKPQYMDADIFENDFAIVQNDSEVFGTINKAGKYSIVPKYQGLKRFFDYRYLAYQKNGLWGIIKNSGEEITPAIYKEIFDIYDGKAIVGSDKHFDLLIIDKNITVIKNAFFIKFDKDGRSIAMFLDKDYSLIILSKDGVVTGKIENALVTIDFRDWEESFDYQYEPISNINIDKRLFIDDSIIFCSTKTEKVGVAKINGQILVDPEYQKMVIFDDLIQVQGSYNTYGYLNSKGEWIWELQG